MVSKILVSANQIHESTIRHTTSTAAGIVISHETTDGASNFGQEDCHIVLIVWFVRGTARYRTWCEIEHRPLGGASRSLQREFEQVIMVEVRIEEMFGCAPGYPAWRCG